MIFNTVSTKRGELQFQSAAIMMDEYLKMRNGLAIAEGKAHSIFGLR
jgi:hypothetical protein